MIIELLQGCLEEEGYEIKRYSDSEKYETIAYDCIAVKGSDGNYYEITISECNDVVNLHTGKVKRAEENA